MLTTVLYLVRHAQIAENLPAEDGRPTGEGGFAPASRVGPAQADLRYGAFPDAPLDDIGRRQAAAVAGRVAEVPFAAVHASPYRRARETADAILDGLVNGPAGLRLTTDARWQERDFGQLDGLTVSQIARVCPPGPEVLYASEEGRPGGAESLREVRARARQAFDQLAERHEGETVLVVSHKTTLRVLICDLLGLPLTTYKRIGQGNAALNVVSVGSDSASPEGRQVWVELVNDTCHLGEIVDAGLADGTMTDRPRR